MTKYTARFCTDADFAKHVFEAEDPQKALAMALTFYEEHSDDLIFEEYNGGQPLNVIEIFDPGGHEVAVWRDEEAQLRFASVDLRNALDALTAASQAVIDNWEKGDLARAVRALDASIGDAKAALNKAKLRRDAP